MKTIEEVEKLKWDWEWEKYAPKEGEACESINIEETEGFEEYCEELLAWRLQKEKDWEDFFVKEKAQLKAVEGITVRDWFAGQALAGICGDIDIGDKCVMAKRSYDIADAMLKERQKWQAQNLTKR